jgi:hypothetical protein
MYNEHDEMSVREERLRRQTDLQTAGTVGETVR